MRTFLLGLRVRKGASLSRQSPELGLRAERLCMSRQLMFAKGPFCHGRAADTGKKARSSATEMPRSAKGSVAPRGRARRRERQGRFTRRFPRWAHGAGASSGGIRCTEPALIRARGFVEVACAVPQSEQIMEGRPEGKTLPSGLDCRGFPRSRHAFSGFARRGAQQCAPTVRPAGRSPSRFRAAREGRAMARPYVRLAGTSQLGARDVAPS